MNSDEIEKYIYNFTQRHVLTPDQNNYFRGIRRLIKNRRYAQTSRNKNKIKYDDVVDQLNAANEEITKLKSNNEFLVDKVISLENMLNSALDNNNRKSHFPYSSSSPTLSPSSTSTSSSPSSFADDNIELESMF
jgi:hypothetical protein